MLSFFPRGVLDEILNLIESVSEGFPSYSLVDRIVAILFISETKIDASFRDQLFQVEGYRLERRERNAYGGGIAAFIRPDIPAKRRRDLETTQTESIIYEVNINSKNGPYYVFIDHLLN